VSITRSAPSCAFSFLFIEVRMMQMAAMSKAMTKRTTISDIELPMMLPPWSAFRPGLMNPSLRMRRMPETRQQSSRSDCLIFPGAGCDQAGTGKGAMRCDGVSADGSRRRVDSAKMAEAVFPPPLFAL
jgi:hypothetical protein